MDSFLRLARHNAKAGRENEFNEWYDAYVEDVLRCQGYISAERFELDPGSESEHRFPAIYRVETDDLESTKALIRALIGSAEMPISDAVDRGRTSSIYWRAISVVRKPRGAPPK
jgi:hypothetical protein